MNGPDHAPVLLMCDLDETLLRGYMDQPNPGAVYRTVRPLAGRVERVATLRAQGVRFAVVTNQAGVAFGHQKERDVERKRAKVWDAFGLHEGPAASWHCCFAHPQGSEPYRLDCGRRKPSPQMLYEAMAQHGLPGAPLIAQDCLFVGDMESDRQAAFAAGVPYLDAKEFFGG